MARCGAGQQAVTPFPHQPLGGLCTHFAVDVLFDPGVHPGLEALVQPGAHPLMRLWGKTRGILVNKGKVRICWVSETVHLESSLGELPGEPSSGRCGGTCSPQT